MKRCTTDYYAVFDIHDDDDDDSTCKECKMWGLRAQIKELREALERIQQILDGDPNNEVANTPHWVTDALSRIEDIAQEALDKRD